MWADVVNNLLALGVGLATGFYFERRATNSARRDANEAQARNEELMETLSNLRAELVSRSPAPAPPRTPAGTEVEDVLEEVLAFARLHQDASGRMKSATLRNGLLAQGHGVAEIDSAIEGLVQQGALRLSGSDWEVQA